MLAAHRQSLRLLQGILTVSALLPVVMFSYASWQAYTTTLNVADRQIAQSRDVLTEHALKVFEAVERSIAETNEVIRYMDDGQITRGAEQLHIRLRKLAQESTHIKSLWIFDRFGHALVNSLEFPSPAIDFSDRDYFRAHASKEVGTYVGEVLRPRAPYGGAPFFGVSRRRVSPDDGFTGVIQASILPEYFEGFYAKIGRDPGSYYSLIREDGFILARFPKLDRDAWLAPQGRLRRAMEANPYEGKLTLVSAIDGAERTVNYLRLGGLPLYVVAGRDAWAVRAEWLSEVKGHLLFGVPTTAVLIGVIVIALRRTRRLYEEAQRRQAAEDALKQAQRLEAVGQLTGGVAHDFNNLLMVIGGSATRLRRMGATPEQGRPLEMIDLAVQRGENLTRKLLSFSRRRALVPQVFDVAARINALTGMLNQSVDSSYRIEQIIPDEITPVKLDPTEFEIALLNLTLNARDAMPDGGTITLELKRVHFDGDAPPARRKGDYAAVSVRDHGDGIPEEIRDRIFEPFFTTKAVDKGTGLGLSQVYGLVTQAGGAVDLTSEVGNGSCFTIYLPIATEAIAPRLSEVSAPLAELGRLRVLLVEDNADVATIAAEYLEQCGCTVLKADSADDAVRLLKDSQVQVVFSDIVMPGMSGLELARLVRDHHPEVGVILASGYSDKAAEAVAEGFRLIEKPFTAEVMQSTIAAVLRDHKARPAAAGI